MLKENLKILRKFVKFLRKIRLFFANNIEILEKIRKKFLEKIDENLF